MCGFKESNLGSVGPGEGTFDVAEHFRFHQLGGQGGAVDGHEGCVFARAVMMQGPGDQFLAGSAFAVNQHRGGGGGHPFDHLAHGAHAGAFGHDAIQLLPVFKARLKTFVLGDGIVIFEGALNGQHQLVELERLGDVIKRTLFHGFDRRGDGAVGGEHDHAHVGPGFGGFTEQFHAVDRSHIDVRNHQIELFGLKELQCFFAVAGGHGFVTLPDEYLVEQV